MSGKPDPLVQSFLTKKTKWRDVPYIFVVLVILIGFIVVSGIDLSDYRRTQCFTSYFGDPRVMFFAPNMLGILAISMGIALVASGLYYIVAACYTDYFIIVSMAIQVMISLGTSVFYLCQLRLLSGVFSLVWLVSSCLMYWFLSPYIKTATTQLNIAMCFAERNPFILVICLLGALFTAAWSTLVGAVILASFGKAITQDCSHKNILRPEGEFLTLLAYTIMCNYLVADLVKAVVRSVVCSTCECWCFMPRKYLTDNENGPVDEYPSITAITWTGLLYALTCYLGALCLSSLLLAASKLLSHAMNAWSQVMLVNGPRPNTQDVSAILLAWIFSHCTIVMDALLNHFSNYVIIFITMKNMSYLDGFKCTLNLLIDQGLTALINDGLACGTLTFSSWCVGSASTLFTYLFMRFVFGYPIEGTFFVCSFVMAVNVQLSSVLLSGVSTGVQTLFVAMSTETHRFQRAHPEACARLASTM